MEFLRDYDIHICTGVRHGYEHMERYYNELAIKTTGDIIFPWSTDAIMKTKNWDEKLEPYLDDFCLLEPTVCIPFCAIDNKFESRQCVSIVAPIINRRVYDVFGYIGQCVTDAWLQKLGLANGIFKPVDIDIHLSEGEVTEKGEISKRTVVTETFKSEEIQSLLRKDIDRLHKYIRDNNIECRKFPYVKSTFLDGIFVDVRGLHDQQYLVEIEDVGSNTIVGSRVVSPFTWALFERYGNHIGRRIKVSLEGEVFYEREFDLENKKVLFWLATNSQEDMDFAIPLIQKFAKKNRCEMIILTMFYEEYTSRYPDIDFRPLRYIYNNRERVNDEIYASYRIGEKFGFRQDLVNLLGLNK
jgi:hypothetical protein